MSESLLVAKVKTEGVSRASEDLKSFVTQAKAAEQATGLLASAAKKAGPALLGYFSVKSASQFVSMVVQTAAAIDDAADAAERLGISLTEFRTMEFIFDTVGVSANEATKIMLKMEQQMFKLESQGKGPLKDALMALSQATDLTAESFDNLSGQQGLQLLVSEMEKARVAHSDQVAILESVAKGSSKLLPLLKDEGQEYKNLADAVKEANHSMGVTGDEIENLQRLDQEVKLLGNSWDLLKIKVSGATAPMVTFFVEFANGAVKATGSVIRLTQHLYEMVDGQKSLKEASEDLNEAYDDLAVLQERLNKLKNEGSTIPNSLFIEIDAQKELLASRQADYDALKAKDDKIRESAVIAETAINVELDAEKKADAEKKRLAAERDRIRAENELAAKRERDLQQQYRDEDATASKQYYADLLAAYKKYSDEYVQDAATTAVTEEYMQRQHFIQLLRDKQISEEDAAELQKIYSDKRSTDVQAAAYSELKSREMLQLDIKSLTADANGQRLIALESQLNSENAILFEGLMKNVLTEEQYQEERLKSTERFFQRMDELKARELSQQYAYYADSASAFESAGQATLELIDKFDGESESRRKKAFYAMKGFAVASASLNLASAIAGVSGEPSTTIGERFAKMAAIAAAVGQVVSTIASAQYTPAREQGGMFGRGTYLVGEKGPELVQFGSGGRIANTQQTQALLNNSGGTGNVTIINQTSGRIDKVEQQQTDKGEMVLIIQEVMASETMNPNSKFNRALSKTRTAGRKL